MRLHRSSAALALQSGTAALHLALILAGVGVQDEVLCPTFTFVASVNPILYQGAWPILIDSEPDTWNMCPQMLEAAIQNRLRRAKRPKALIIVHLYGQSAKMDELLALARHYQLSVIEDAAEALGSTCKGKKLGTLGDMGIYSFNGNKIITTLSRGYAGAPTGE
ncbi:MAG: hypothetical protein HC880_17620 [Bacteroidia bacterium]|nr:hypothetical protein [Bacteroidia bacterium]